MTYFKVSTKRIPVPYISINHLLYVQSTDIQKHPKWQHHMKKKKKAINGKSYIQAKISCRSRFIIKGLQSEHYMLICRDSQSKCEGLNINATDLG